MLKYDKQPFLFTRRRKRLCLISTFLVSLLFISYQFLIYYLLSSQKPKYSPKVSPTGTRGVHVQEKAFYTPVLGKFTCIKSREVIDFIKVNDDYCDCADSSDEPGTNACPDGLFYCSSVSTNTKYPKMVHSSRVNDGICDCCDGSEEYDVQHLLGQQRYQTNSVVCPNNC